MNNFFGSLVLIFILTFSFSSHLHAQDTLYVDQSIFNSGDGKTPVTAFKTIDEAVATTWKYLGEVKCIVVATGVYTPTQKPYDVYGSKIHTTDDRDVTIHLPEGVHLIGNNAQLNGMNVYHVIICSGNNVISGFHILGGNANGTGFILIDGIEISRSVGGGIYCIGGKNTIKENVLNLNVADTGGAIYYTNKGLKPLNFIQVT